MDDEKQCIFCKQYKPLSEFKMRKRPPIKPYAACKACEDVAYGRKKKVTYADEMTLLRDKAKELRRFTPEQDVVLYKRKVAGETVAALAAEFNVSKGAVYNAIKRGGLDTAGKV